MAGHGRHNAQNSKFDPSAVRGLLGKTFLTSIASDFRQHGRRTIVRLRNHRGHDYLRLVAALLPQEYRLKEVSFQDVSDQELAAVLTAIRAAIAEKEKEQSGGGASAPETRATS